MSEWKEATLGNLAEVQTGPFGSQLKNEQYIKGGTPVVTVEHIKNFLIEDFAYPSITNEDKNRLKKYTLRPGDIVFSRVGSVDLSALVKEHQSGWLFSSRMLRVRVKEKLDTDFLAYYLRQSSIRQFIINVSVGSTMPSINTEILKSLPIAYCPLEEQKQVAAVLSSLDYKIENLRRQNKTLEAIAQTLFKHWFVDFEFPNEDGNPYKSSGGAMVRSELGEIPEGWYVGRLGDLFTLNYGKSLTLENRVSGQYPVVGSSGIVGSHKSYLVNAPSIVIGRKGTIGQVIWLEENFYPIDTTFYVEDIFGCNGLYFYYFLLKRQNFQRLTSDSAVPGLNRDMAYSVEIAIPKIRYINKFNTIVKAAFNKINLNQKQIETLIKTRDVLLPQLMSGKLPIRN